MPIWLRKFTFNELEKFYKEEQESYEKINSQGKTTVVDPSGKVNTPAFLAASKNHTPPKNQPTYITKASKK